METLLPTPDTALVWLVAGGLLFWPHFVGRWRTALAVVTSALGVLFLILAVNTEGLRETPTVSMFLMGQGYVTQRAEALASLHYYAMTALCFLMGTAGLALSEARVARLRVHWLTWAVGLSLLITTMRFVLEKLAAPRPWTQAVGITGAAPIVGAYFLYNVRREGRGLAALVSALLLYGFFSRAAVAGLMAAASAFRWGSHYDVSSLVQVVNPLTRQTYDFEPGSLHQILSLGVLPQLAVWPFFTLASGLVGALGFAVLRRLSVASPTS